MDRNREARRSTSMAAPNGLARRRHRTSLRDSPEEDGPVELQETTRLRDRGGSVKKDRDRTRDRDRDRDRDRLSRNKRRAERMLHGSNREDGGDETSEESVNDEEEEEDDRGGAGDVGGSGHMRLVPPLPMNYQPSSLPSSMSNHNNRRSFPPAAAAAKVFRPAAPWKAADEMIGVSVPRKARSASIKRSHEWLSSGGHIVSGSSGEHILRQASASPVRTSLPATTASPISPSSSNASGRKKMKPDGPKLPPKSSSKSSSSDQEEIEIEIAEVLYGMMRQPQVPSKSEVSDSMRFESSREESRFAGDAKSRISSPVPNSPTPALAQNSSSALTPLSVTAPKRKKPRQVKYDDESQPTTISSRNSPISATTTKAEIDQKAKIDAAVPNLEKVRVFLKENGVGPYDLAKPGMEAHLRKLDDTHELKPLRGEAAVGKEGGPLQSSSPLKESSSLRLDDNRVDSIVKATKVSEIENQREEKFQIDLMAPPPSRSSPDRDGDGYLSSVDPKKPLVPDMKTESKPISSNDGKSAKVFAGEGEHRLNAVAEEAKSNAEAQKNVISMEKTTDLQLDLDKIEIGAAAAASISKLNQQFHKQQSSSQPVKNAQVNNPLNFPMSVAGWPGAMPPMGYMAAPLQGVVSMDGSTVVSAAAIQPPQWLFNQPRQKKCATHCYIARNIQYHQQMARMNSFWQPATAAASASMYGGKTTNLNVVPPAELHGAAPTNRAAGNLMLEKNQNMSLFSGKEKAPPASNDAGIDASQRKQQQVLLQQSVPAGAPNNILGPTFIFPLTQQHAAAAATVRSGAAAGKPNNTGTSSSSATMSTSPSSAITGSAAAATATAMSFNYPNMPSGETQYLAILQNNPYPFPVPAHVGAGPQYRGNPAQPMPFFNGSFYSSQMLHPAQLQQAPNLLQQQQQNQNASISTTSSSSQKHHQSQQHRPQGSAGSGSLQGFPAAKHPSSQQQQQQQNQHGSSSHHADGAEDADGRASQSNMNIYAQSFPMAMHAQNFTLMQSAAAAANASPPGHAANEKKLPSHHQQGPKAGFDSLPSQAFAMSFASLNGGSASAQNLDTSSMAPSHASILQSLPEATRQMFAASQTVVQKKNFRASEDGKGGGGNDTSASTDDERKSMSGKGHPQSMGHIAFSRSDMTETANVVDSSARTLNLGTSVRVPSNTLSSASSQQQQLQRNHQQHQHLQQQQQQLQHQQQQQQHQQQMIQLQKQQQYAVAAAAAAARSKSQAVASNSSNGPNQSSQWKSSSSARGSAAAASTQSQVPPTLNSATASIKGHPQQQSRPLQGQTQISFAAANSKAVQNAAAHAQQQQQSLTSSNQTQQAVGSPTASSMSKSAGGSPRTSATCASTGNKTPQASSLSNHHHQQQGKTSSSSIPSHKASPVAGNVPSMLGNSHIMSSSAAGTKHHQQQQQQQQSLQQTQLFFTHPYMQVHNPHSPSAASAGAAASNAYYHGRRSSDPQQQLKQPLQQQHGSSGTSSSGMLSLCSPTNNITCDPVKAVAASNMKSGVGHHSQGVLHSAPFTMAQASGSPHQLMPAGFTYVHTMPNAVQAKAAEQKQPAAAREESRRSDN